MFAEGVGMRHDERHETDVHSERSFNFLLIIMPRQ